MASWFIAALRQPVIQIGYSASSSWVIGTPRKTFSWQLICQLHASSIDLQNPIRIVPSTDEWASRRFIYDRRTRSVNLLEIIFLPFNGHTPGGFLGFSIKLSFFLIAETSSFSLRRLKKRKVTFWMKATQVHQSRSVWLFKESRFATNCETSHSYIVIGRNPTSTRDRPTVQKASRAVNSIVPKNQ